MCPCTTQIHSTPALPRVCQRQAGTSTAVGVERIYLTFIVQWTKVQHLQAQGDSLCLWLHRAQQHGPDACKDGDGTLCTSKEDETFMNRLDAEVHRVNR